MYQQHCLGTIAPAMRSNLATFKRGFMFAVCSIRQPTINVPDQLAILFDNAEGENPLFGHKFAAWDFINTDAKAKLLWHKLCLMYALQSREATKEALRTICATPGLGLVKGAFTMQLMGFDVACLDARNITREGRNPRAFRTDGMPVSEGKLEAYLVETYGKAEHYWDAWCRDVAAAYDRTPEAISELHLAIVPGDFIPF